jgi:hypothetical protein
VGCWFCGPVATVDVSRTTHRQGGSGLSGAHRPGAGGGRWRIVAPRPAKVATWALQPPEWLGELTINNCVRAMWASCPSVRSASERWPPCQCRLAATKARLTYRFRWTLGAPRRLVVCRRRRHGDGAGEGLKLRRRLGKSGLSRAACRSARQAAVACGQQVQHAANTFSATGVWAALAPNGAVDTLHTAIS